MEHYRLYHNVIPAFVRQCLTAPELKRLAQVGMNCGCEYTAFPRFRGLATYSRLDHSIGAALIVWHFTGDRTQALSGLLHDIATPVFAHVVDFMRGDYLKQESTEDGTGALIEGSAGLQAVLRKYGLTTEDVYDYHRYPIADNDSPRLSADRLEYTMGNSINFGICTEEEIRQIYGDLTVGTNEDGQDELMFRSESAADAFAHAALACSKIYVSDEDRYAMQILAEVLRGAVEMGVIGERDLYGTEPEVIARLLSDERTAKSWNGFRSLTRMERAEQPGPQGRWRQIRAKKRCIDPMVQGRGRFSAVLPAFASELEAFRSGDQAYWICGSPGPR